MAIVIEEEKSGVGLVRIVTWVVILIIIVVAVYYIFFQTPPLIEYASPPNYQNINALAPVNLNPEELINGQSFQSLKQYVTLPVPGNAGRSNPFLAP